MANETLDFATRDNKDCLLFKVYFEKAYTMVNWYFIRYMLKRMGFGAVWMRWVEVMVFSSQMSVLVNGNLTKDFIFGRGLWQGGLISLFLFIVVVEGLTCLVRKASKTCEYKGFYFFGQCIIDLLQFADDTLFIGEGNWKNVWVIKYILHGFEIVYGLGVNFHKSIVIGLI